MRTFRKELWFHVPSRRAFINITPQVEECLHESEIREGLVLVNAMHITASVFINDDERGLHHDYVITYRGEPLSNKFSLKKQFSNSIGNNLRHLAFPISWAFIRKKAGRRR